VQFGVNGTPAMVLSNGYVLPGYQGPKELKAFLMSIKNRQAVNNSRETTDTTTPP
jgi:predicted DsbA family dithiol-disulfide isomerase